MLVARGISSIIFWFFLLLLSHFWHNFS